MVSAENITKKDWMYESAIVLERIASKDNSFSPSKRSNAISLMKIHIRFKLADESKHIQTPNTEEHIY